MGLSPEGITAVVLLGALVVLAGAFLGVGFILALIGALIALGAAALSNAWRVISGTLLNVWNLFMWPFNYKWAFLIAVLIWWFGLSVIEFQNEEMQAIDVFYECTMYDPIYTFTKTVLVPFRKVFDFVVPRWNDLVLYVRDCIRTLINQWPNFLQPAVPTRSEVVQAISASGNFTICLILAPVSIDSWNIPYFTSVLAGWLDVVVCFIQLAVAFLSAIILDPANFFNGPCFVLLDQFFDCVLAFFLFITASGFNGLLDTWIEDLVDSMHCFVAWLKHVGIDIAKLQLQSTWVDRGMELCACIGDFFANVLTGGLFPELGDFVECLCAWIINTMNVFLQDPVSAGQNFPETLGQLCDCIEQHLLPLSTALIWQESIGFLLCLCNWVVGLLTAGRDYELLSGDCYFCQRCPTCRVTAAGVANGCSLRSYGAPFTSSNSTTVICQIIVPPTSCQSCCSNCASYCTCSGCHDFVSELVFCFCDYIEFLAYDNFLSLVPFRGFQIVILRTACNVLVSLLNMWRPVLRALNQYGFCTFPTDPISGVEEVLSEWLGVMDSVISLVSNGATCAAWSPIPIPFFLASLPELVGACDSFVFVAFLQIIEFIIDLVAGIGFQDVIDAILCLVTSGFATCVSDYPTGGASGTGSPYPACSLAYCWDLYSTCIEDIGGIWTPVIDGGFFSALGVLFTFLDFVLCPVAEILDCFLTNQFGTPYPNLGQLASVSGNLRNLAVCIGNIPVDDPSYPFHAFSVLLLPLIDLNTAFLNAFGNTNFTTVTGTFTNLFAFITGLKTVSFGGYAILSGFMSFLVEPAAKLMQCATTNFTLSPSSTTVDNSPLFISAVLVQLNNFNACVQSQVSIGSVPGLIFAPLEAIILRPLVSTLYCFVSNLNPRPTSFTAAFTRLQTMCTCAAGITWGSDAVIVGEWVWAFVGYLKTILACFLNAHPANLSNYFTNKGFWSDVVICVRTTKYEPSGIPSSTPLYNFAQVIGTQIAFMSDTIESILSYITILASAFSCFKTGEDYSEEHCCSNPITHTGEFIEEIEEIFKQLGCFGGFGDLKYPPAFPTRRRDPSARYTAEEAEQWAQYREDLRAWWDEILETEFKIERNSTCGTVLYGHLLGEQDWNADWLTSMRYASCVKMMDMGKTMNAMYPEMPMEMFNTPSAAMHNIFHAFTQNLTMMASLHNLTAASNSSSSSSNGTQARQAPVTFHSLTLASRPRAADSDHDYSQGFASIADIEQMVHRELERQLERQLESGEVRNDDAGLPLDASALTLDERPRDDMDEPPEVAAAEEAASASWRDAYRDGEGDDGQPIRSQVWQAFLDSRFGEQIRQDYASVLEYARNARDDGTNHTEEMIGGVWSGFARYVRRYREWRDDRRTNSPSSSMQEVHAALAELAEMRSHMNASNFNATAEVEFHVRKHGMSGRRRYEQLLAREGGSLPPSRAALRRQARLGIIGNEPRTRQQVAARLHRKIFGLGEPLRKRGELTGPFLMPAMEQAPSFASLWSEYQIVKEEQEALAEEEWRDQQAGEADEWYLGRQDAGEAVPERAASRRHNPLGPRAARTFARAEPGAHEALRRRMLRERVTFRVPQSVLGMVVSGAGMALQHIMPGRLLPPSTPAPFNWNDKALSFLDWLWTALFHAPAHFWSDKVVLVTYTFQLVLNLIEPIWNGLVAVIHCKIPEQFDGTDFYNPFCFPLLPETLFDWIQPLPTKVFQIQMPWPTAIIDHNCVNTNGGPGPLNCPSDPPDNVRPLCPVCDYCERSYLSCRDNFGWEDGFDNLFYWLVLIPRWFSQTFANHDTFFSSRTFHQLLLTYLVHPFIFALPGSFGVLVIPIYGPIALYIPYYTAYFWVLGVWFLSFPFQFPDISQFDVATLLKNIVSAIGILLPFGSQQFLLSRIQQVAYPVTVALPTVDTFCWYVTFSNIGLTFIVLITGWYVFAILGNLVAAGFLVLFAFVTSIAVMVQAAMIRFLRENLSSVEVRTDASEAVFYQLMRSGGRPALAVARAIGVPLSEDDIHRINEGDRETFESVPTVAPHHTAPAAAPLVQQFMQQMARPPAPPSTRRSSNRRPDSQSIV